MRVAPDKMQLVRFDWRVRAEVVRSPLGVPHTPSSTVVPSVGIGTYYKACTCYPVIGVVWILNQYLTILIQNPHHPIPIGKMCFQGGLGDFLSYLIKHMINHSSAMQLIFRIRADCNGS